VLVDPFTVGAQILNFLVLIYLLKRFLYGPIIRGMDRREERIRGRLRAAEEQRLVAEKEAGENRRRGQELEESRADRLREAKAEAEERRRELVKRAREEAEEVREAWREAIGRERGAFVQELKRRAGSEIARIARRSVADLAGEDFSLKLIESFLGRLHSLEGAARENFARAAEAAEVTVRSSFETDPPSRKRITEAIRAVGGSPGRVRFESDSTMAPGIEVTAGGVRLSWGVDSYFERLEKNLSELLEQHSASFSSGDRGGGKTPVPEGIRAEVPDRLRRRKDVDAGS
jgi:F-type H+-transporting ATPase subunit b